jgi:myo-inositol-1(or 4)-monophosphatase
MAGRVATSFVGSTAQTWDKPGGAGPVTEADLAVNDLLHSVLRLARPSYGWLSEETDDTASRLSDEYVFIIDPIDGTRSFVEGSSTWAHSLAISKNGVVTAAVVYLPLRDKLYAAGLGVGATLNGKSIIASDTQDLSDANILATKPSMIAKHWASNAEPNFKRSHRPSLAYRLGLVGQGRFDAMITLRPSWEWDIAAGALIVTEAGGTCSDQKGLPLRFNNPDPRLNGVVAGGSLVHRALVDALA